MPQLVGWGLVEVSNRVMEAVVGAALDGMRVDRAVALTADVSRARAAALVNNQMVRLAGSIVTSGSQRCKAGEQLTVWVGDVRSTDADNKLEADHEVVFEVVHSDEDVVVVNKPAGLVVHPGAGHSRGTLANGLLARFPETANVGEPFRPGIVHRLDRYTSGLMMVARSTRAYKQLTAQLRARQTKRVYTTLVWCHPDSDVGVIEAPIGRSNRNPTRMAVTKSGRHAVTHYRVKSRFTQPTDVTLLECRLETGRTHQIRVHLHAIGHRLVGDPVYGAGNRPNTPNSQHFSDLQRPFLHATSLSFDHPASHDTRLTFESELPDDLAAVLATCQT